jgi:hypothetical protein
VYRLAYNGEVVAFKMGHVKSILKTGRGLVNIG